MLGESSRQLLSWNGSQLHNSAPALSTPRVWRDHRPRVDALSARWLRMQVHYVTPIVFGVVVALLVFALMVLMGRAAQTGHPPPL